MELENFKGFAADFSQTIIDQDFTAAHQFLALWLQNEISSDDLKAKFEAELWEMNCYWDISELIYPQKFHLEWNSCDWQTVKKYANHEPNLEMSEEIFRKWMAIEFLPDENDERIEFDGWFDFWLAIVEINGELKIGYFEFEDVD